MYKDFPVPNASGHFKSPFNLRITRQGCEYDGLINPSGSGTDALLSQWFEHSTVSGYGDNRSLETKIDHDVRSAREILPTEFSVEPQLIDLIQETWAAHFIPAQVRVEPYKIHLYGPGGHFKSHCDTPEKGLVGTFLVGLGDTSAYYSKGHFHIGGETLKADPCSWVAFHPDVPHSVSKLKENHRAVIAFKVFHNDAKGEETKVPQLEQRLKETSDQMEPPYAILLDHKYCMGTTEMSGLDSFLLTSARSRTDMHVHVIPVVTEFHGTHWLEDDSDVPDVGCRVYPLTEAHVDILLERNVEQAKESVKWLEGVRNIPFYSLQGAMSSAFVWHSEIHDAAEYTGNSSAPFREDSIYLNYAMLVLSATHASDAANESQDQSDGFSDASDF